MATLVALQGATAAAAPGDDFGATVNVQVALPGFATPPGLRDDPCASYPGFTEYQRSNTHTTMDATLGWVFEGSGVSAAGIPGVFVTFVGEGSYAIIEATAMEAVVETHVRWAAWCFDPVSTSISFDSLTTYWVPIVSQETVVPALLARLEEYLQPPVVSFPSADPEFGWLYVKAPMDVRISEPEGVSLTATVTNVTGSVTATVTATPSQVSFEPGDPGVAPVVCSIGDATASYSVEQPGACSVAYVNSSAIAPEAKFWTRTILTFDVETTSDSFPGGPVVTGAWNPVEVAEVQAIAVAPGWSG